jgi:hypothetical protein
MKNSIIFISNAIGGIKTFQDTLIKFVIQNNIECILLDQINLNIKNKKKIKYFKIKVLDEIYNTLKILINLSNINKGKRSIFIFSNPVIFVIYFFFIKLFFKNSKIFFFVHSHLTKKNILLTIINYVSSILFIFINRIFYVSKFTKEWWDKNYFFSKYAKNTIQYNSVELSDKINSKNRRFSIGFIGRVSREKGLNKFLDIAYENRKKFVFKIFSDEKLKKKIKQKKFIKYYYNKNISTIYKNIDLLLITSPIENCPYTVLEAKSYGIPTLVYKTKGGINEILKNNFDGIIIKDKKNIRVFDYIIKIKKNYKFFSSNAFSNSKKFNAKTKIKKLIFDELLK